MRFHHHRHRGDGRRCRRPRSLFGRLMLIWLLGLAVVLAVSSWLFLGERGRTARNNLFDHIAQDVVTVVALMDRLPPQERPAALSRLARTKTQSKAWSQSKPRRSGPSRRWPLR